jgi:hypothetical protein
LPASGRIFQAEMIAIIESKTAGVCGDLIEIILPVYKTKGDLKAKFFQVRFNFNMLTGKQEVL